MKANSIEEYLGTLQSAMKESWKSHLKTHKYSDHKALNEFYDDIVDLVDGLIESYQGLHGVVEDLKNIMSTDKMDAVKYLEELREMTEDGKEQFIKEDELKSDVDAILSLIDQTLYKLKELKEGSLVSLTDYLYENLTVNESIRRDDAEKAIYDLLVRKTKENHISIDNNILRDLANEVLTWYENEEALEEYRKVQDFIDYVEDDLLSMADAAEYKYQKLIYKIFGM